MTSGIAFTPEEVAEKKQTIIDWLELSVNGTFTKACQIAGVSKREGYNWRREDAEFTDRVDKARKQGVESGLDFAERHLMKQIRAGNTTALIFYLKCLGKDRGYIDRVQMGWDQESPISVTVNHELSREYLYSRLLRRANDGGNTIQHRQLESGSVDETKV